MLKIMMTLRTTLFCIVGTLGVLVVGFSGINGYTAYRQHQAHARFLETDRISEALLKLSADLAIERGLSNAPLHAPDALSSDRRGEIANVRVSADKALPEILEQLRQIPALAESKQALDEAESAYHDYMAFRRKVDENLIKPKQERSAEVVDTFAPTITNVIDRLNRIRLIMEALVTSPDATMVQLVQVRSLVAEMAEEAGRERAVFGGNVAQKAPFSQDDIRKLSPAAKSAGGGVGRHLRTRGCLPQKIRLDTQCSPRGGDHRPLPAQRTRMGRRVRRRNWYNREVGECHQHIGARRCRRAVHR
jgi:methyl-accepting chemotaxis protein